MNKKFFTLIAGAFMLVASLGTVNAQSSYPTDLFTGGLTTQAQKYLYHLVGEVGADKYFLVVDNDGKLYLKTTADYTAGNYKFGNALWCVNVSDREDQGLNPTFTFENKGAGLKLGISKDDEDIDPIDIRFGALTRFEFSRVYKNSLEAKKPLKLYYNEDNVLTFVRNAAGHITVKAYPATAADITEGSYGANVVLFSLYKPDEVILTAEQFNTILNTEPNGWVTLNFVPAPSDASEFQTAIKAEDVTPGWLKFFRNTTDANKKWLRVDTAYTGDYGVKFLKFAFGDAPSAADAKKAAIERQYYFQARYHVLNDSLAIDVQQAIFPEEGYKGYWYNYAPTVWGTNNGSDSLHVKLQDLIAGERSILTIGTKEVSTRVELGLKSCASVPVNLTSVPNNLYTIKNNAGQYLVVLINTDTVTGSQRSAPRWMTLNEATQNPNRIPAFQWVVEQTRTDFPTSSPIRITNREFGDTTEDGVNLDYHRTIGGETIQLTTTGSSLQLYGETVYAANFKEVPTPEKGNKYLGYKYLPNDSLKFNTYDFNYLHELNAEKYLYIKNTTDSSIYLNTTTQSRTQFELIAQGTPKRYGYWTAAVPGLAKLEKVSYVLRVKDGYALNRTGAVVVADGEGRYAVTKAAVADTSVFLLKTNNTKDGRDYYALLDTGYYGLNNSNNVHKDVKVGIDDANAWAYEQDQNEFRTSTFFIAPYNEPIYRRFDGAEYGKYKIKEPYGNSSNAPLYLRFAKHNNWGTEFLFENSPRGIGSKDPGKTTENDYRDELTAKGKATISFLGLYNEKDYPANGELFNYTFYVDTAYVRYATPMPQYMLAVRPEFVTGDTIYRITKDSVWDSNGKTLLYVTSDTTFSIRPSFTRAFYVFNAQDSIGAADPDNQNARNKDYVGKFAYGAEYTTRLAFVDGIHMGDTFYVLRKNPATTSIDSAYLLAIPRADKHYLGANTHYTPRWGRDGNPIWGTNGAYTNDHNGKSMVFQFRLYDPDGTSDQSVDAKLVRKFLIESRQDDGTEIGPLEGRWVKIQNGVPVISERIELTNARQNGAEIFNVLESTIGDKAVGNEKAVVSSDVQVIGGAGTVTILNAGGKKVAISNILGQTVANQVVSSDNVTIALPKGIVVVAIDGEAAVKAIVK
ncbi:MAG: DUF6383 domain-containing protein [Tannerellaceae bacterium]|jgi:hypothetical protein|nr:DUF6383 domain-containing protein [Tannerellaceae bacterium]